MAPDTLPVQGHQAAAALRAALIGIRMNQWHGELPQRKNRIDKTQATAPCAAVRASSAVAKNLPKRSRSSGPQAFVASAGSR